MFIYLSIICQKRILKFGWEVVQNETFPNIPRKVRSYAWPLTAPTRLTAGQCSFTADSHRVLFKLGNEPLEVYVIIVLHACM